MQLKVWLPRGIRSSSLAVRLCNGRRPYTVCFCAALKFIQANHHHPFSSQTMGSSAADHSSLKPPLSADSLSSRKAKHRTDKHRLLLAELLHLYPDLQLQSRTPALDEDSNSSHSKATTNPSESPTDSHAHRRSDSQPRSRRSHDSISSILLMTTEKLHSETARANAAERHIADVMSLFKNADRKSVV